MRLIAEIFYFLIIGVALLNHGAVDSLVIAIFCLSIFTFLVTIILFVGISARTVKVLFLSSAILAASGIWVVFQTTPLPYAIFAHPAWKEVKSLAPNLHAVISITPYDDRIGWLRVAAPFGVFFVGLLLFSTDKSASRALVVIGLSSGVIALFSIFQFIVTPSFLIFGPKVAYLDSLTGFFVNRNTAATYFGIVAILNLSLFSHMVRGERGVDAHGVGRGAPRRAHLFSCIGLSISFASCTIALMLTNSRAGIGSTFVAVIILLLLKIFRPTGSSLERLRQGVSVRQRALTLSIFSSVAVGIFAAFAGRMILRARVQGVDDPRFCVLPGVVRAARDSFPWGSGLSSFSEIFAAYRDPQCGSFGTWDMAHNFYAEGVVTLGVAFVLLLLVAVVSLLRVYILGIKNRRSMRFAGELGISTLSLVLIHSAFDFSLQVSGLAIVFATLLAPLTVICLGTRGGGRRRFKSELTNLSGGERRSVA